MGMTQQNASGRQEDSERTPGEIAVVKPYYLAEEAYNMGHDLFPDGIEDPEALAHYRESAQWANTVAPKLRCMAGYAYTAGGTWTKNREVAVVLAGAEEDEPAEADLVQARHVFELLVECFGHGALDAARGEKNVEDLPREV